MISQIIANFKCESENQNLDNLGILWSSYKTEMSFEFWKKVVHEKMSKVSCNIAHSYLQLYFVVFWYLCLHLEGRESVAQ